MRYFYQAFSLVICSDQPLHVLSQIEAAETPDIQIWFNQPLHFANNPSDWSPHPTFRQQVIRRHPHDFPTYYISHDLAYTQIRFPDGAVFTFDAHGSEVWVSAPEHHTFAYVVSYIFGAVLNFCLALRHLTSLHASAVIVDDRAVLFCAPSGFGKSTLALYFAIQGHALLSDDTCVLHPQANVIHVIPSFPHVRHWKPEILAQSVVSQPFAPDWTKHYVNLEHNPMLSFAAQSYPIGAVYLLAHQSSGFTISPLPQMSGLIHLMDNTLSAGLMAPNARAHEFRALSQLVLQAPVSQLAYPRSVDQLSDLYNFVLSDYRNHGINSALLMKEPSV